MRKLFLMLVLTSAFITHALAESVQFSATAVQTDAEGKTTTSKLYFGDGVVRTESSYEGQARVSIINHKQRIAWMLNPEKKEYVEMRGPAPGPQQGEASRPVLPEEPASPCQAGRRLRRLQYRLKR